MKIVRTRRYFCFPWNFQDVILASFVRKTFECFFSFLLFSFVKKFSILSILYYENYLSRRPFCFSRNFQEVILASFAHKTFEFLSPSFFPFVKFFSIPSSIIWELFEPTVFSFLLILFVEVILAIFRYKTFEIFPPSYFSFVKFFDTFFYYMKNYLSRRYFLFLLTVFEEEEFFKKTLPY